MRILIERTPSKKKEPWRWEVKALDNSTSNSGSCATLHEALSIVTSLVEKEHR